MRRKLRKRAPRLPDAERPDIGAYRARHLALGERRIDTDVGHARVVVDENESPLIWLARRRGRDGRALVEPHQFQAGERLRQDFTHAHLMPNTTSNWSNPLASPRQTGAAGAGAATDTMVAARQRVHQALDAVEPEFSGLLLDVCCFLKRLEDVERERAWPVRSGKVVLQLALERLARHYGFAAQARGPSRARIRTWLADGASFRVDLA
ncbi:MAG TPA: DUF6456 domain-containing protein [Pseudolabrys sp.]|jgi:uncharacterized protein DUF6456|nr:DUF6456 domain-containing protein [Pseudolabrys sp.]